MIFKKTHKTKKSKKMHGRKMGTHGTGARKKKRDSGNKGGKGLAGTGKRADHKKSMILKKYGHRYFGKKGITSIGTKKDKTLKINLREIESNIENFIKKNKAKKIGDMIEIDLSKYKILGDGELNLKLRIKAKSASKTAIEKIKKKGGEIINLKK